MTVTELIDRLTALVAEQPEIADYAICSVDYSIDDRGEYNISFLYKVAVDASARTVDLES